MSNRGHNTFGLDPNYAAENKWYLYVPLKTVLGDASTDLDLAISQFYLPGLTVATSTTAFKGYEVVTPQPKLINPKEKTMKFRYIVNDDWYNYCTLYTWAVKLGVLNNEIDANPEYQAAANSSVTNNFLNARLYLLSPFKKKLIEFVFEYAFIQNFGEILLSYENSRPVMHDITLAYNFYRVIRHSPAPFINEEIKKDEKIN